MEGMASTILVIDDERDLVELLCTKLKTEGYQLVFAYDGVQGLHAFQRYRPDLVLLDVLMPRLDGWEVCGRIRELSDVPIILLTALSGDLNLVRGLEMGADDYVIKPFSLIELSARIRSRLRRCKHHNTLSTRVRVDEHLIVDRALCQAVVDGKAVDLSPTEFKLLVCFLENTGRILTHQSLLTQVWGWEYAEQIDYLKVYVHNLRKKIEKDPRRPSYILTERGMGYRFQMPGFH
jgi:two-component system KDP operon response regulator KdpE